MDYIFFAFSALCVSFAVILGFQQAAGRDMQPRLLLIVLAFAAGGAFYYLETSFAGRSQLFYYIANSLPQLILAGLLVLIFSKRSNP